MSSSLVRSILISFTDDVCLRLAEVFGQLPDLLSRAVAEPHDDEVRYALIVSIEALLMSRAISGLRSVRRSASRRGHYTT